MGEPRIMTTAEIEEVIATQGCSFGEPLSLTPYWLQDLAHTALQERARVARLAGALRTARYTLAALPTLFPAVQGSASIEQTVAIIDSALADAPEGEGATG